MGWLGCAERILVQDVLGGEDKDAQKKAGVRCCWACQFMWDAQAVHLEVVGSSFGSCCQCIWDAQTVHPKVVGSSVGSCCQFIWNVQAVHVEVLGPKNG